MKSVKINVEYLKVVNYALCHNKIPICQSIDIVNTSEAPLEDVQVLCDLRPYLCRIPVDRLTPCDDQVIV